MLSAAIPIVDAPVSACASRHLMRARLLSAVRRPSTEGKCPFSICSMLPSLQDWQDHARPSNHSCRLETVHQKPGICSWCSGRTDIQSALLTSHSVLKNKTLLVAVSNMHEHEHEHNRFCQPASLYVQIGELAQLRDLTRQAAKVLVGERQSCQVFQGAQGSGKACEARGIRTMP